tara:strand:- start:2283 stop:3371 length:1089 start_codon:yes stop_codon:yes gene_type:complete
MTYPHSNCFQKHLVSKIYEQTYKTPIKNNYYVFSLKKILRQECNGYKNLENDIKNDVYMRSYKQVYDNSMKYIIEDHKSLYDCEPCMCVYVKNVIQYLLDDTIKFVKAWILAEPQLIESFIKAKYDYRKMDIINWENEEHIRLKNIENWNIIDEYRISYLKKCKFLKLSNSSVKKVAILLIKMYIVTKRINQKTVFSSKTINNTIIATGILSTGFKMDNIYYDSNTETLGFKYRDCLMNMYDYFPENMGIGLTTFEHLFHTYLFCLDTKHCSKNYIHMFNYSNICLQRLQFEFGKKKINNNILEKINNMLQNIHNNKYANCYVLLTILPEDIVNNIDKYFVCPNLDFGELSYYMHKICINDK